MKSPYWRLIAFAILILAVLILWKSCFRKEEKIIKQEQKIAALDSAVTKYKDKAGHEHARKEVEDTRNVSMLLENDSLKKLLAIRDQQLLEATSVTLSSSGKIEMKNTLEALPSKSGHKSDTGRRFAYRDKWLQLNGFSTNDFTTIDYHIDDSLTVSTYYKKKWLLGKKKTYVDIFSANPNTTITGLRKIRREIKVPGRLGIGPFVGATWGLDGKVTPTYGVGLSYQLIRF